jgi:hypothetical protein
MDEQINIPFRKTEVDNPLIPKESIPFDDDGLLDSTKILDHSLSGLDRNIRDGITGPKSNIWDVDPSTFYGSEQKFDGDIKTRKFNLGRFNKEFEKRINVHKNEKKLEELKKLEKLKEEKSDKKISELTISEILIGTKNTWFHLLDDLLDQNFGKDTFTKDNRLFYVGLTFFILAVILYLYLMMSNKENKSHNENKSNIQKIYHIYPNPLREINHQI